MTVLNRLRGGSQYKLLLIGLMIILSVGVSAYSVRLFPICMSIVLIVLVNIIGINGISVLYIWISVQNLVIPLLYSLIGGDTTIWVIALSASEVAACVMVLIKGVAFARKNFFKSPWVLATMSYILLGIVFFVFHHSSNLFFDVYNLRMLFIPVLFFSLGYLYSEGNPAFARISKVVVYVSLIGGFLGIIDAFLLGPDLWVKLNMGSYWINIKHLPASSVYNGLPGNFYEAYGGELLRRAVSFYGDPLAAGYSMAIGFGALLLTHENEKNKLKWYTALVVLLLAITVTYTRAAYLMVLIEVVVFCIYRKKVNRPVPKLPILIVAILLMAVAGKVIISTLTLQNGSAQIHLHAFSKIPFMLRHPLGFGAGASGGPEGAYFQVYWQFGALVLLAFIYWIYRTLRAIPRRPLIPYYLSISIAMALLVSGIFSQEMMTDTAAGVGWLILGLASGVPRADTSTESGQL